MSWLRGMSKGSLALAGVLVTVIVVLLGVIVDLKGSSQGTPAAPTQVAQIAVKSTFAPTAAAPSNAPLPTDTLAPNDTPIPQGTPLIRDTNTGDATYAVLGGNLSDWVARFGQPMGTYAADGPAQFGPCPGDPTYPLYTVQSIDNPMSNPSFGVFNFQSPPQDRTQLVTTILGGGCPRQSTTESAMLQDAMQFFPPDASPEIGSCTDATGDMFKFYTSPTFAAAVGGEYQTFDGTAQDCAGNPLPPGSFTWEADMGNNGHLITWQLDFTGGA